MGEPAAMPAVDIGKTAFFFDFDGTLVEIAPEPHLVEVAPHVLRSLSLLKALSGGAVGIVSGRELAQIDHYLSPLVFPGAGVHGVEIRHADGKLTRALADETALDAVLGAVRGFADRHDGLLVELKHGSIALHYRQRPDLEAACLILAEEVARGDRLHVLRGKMVIEFKASPLTKGTAIAALLAEKPFKGRRALFVGDDITDEHGFAAINKVGGFSVKVGPGESCAQFRLASVEALGRWLEEITGPDRAWVAGEQAASGMRVAN